MKKQAFLIIAAIITSWILPGSAFLEETPGSNMSKTGSSETLVTGFSLQGG